MAFLVVCIWKAGGVKGSAAAEKLKRYGAMWQALYGAAWLLALGYLPQAAGLAALAVAGFLTPPPVDAALFMAAGIAGIASGVWSFFASGTASKVAHSVGHFFSSAAHKVGHFFSGAAHFFGL